MLVRNDSIRRLSITMVATAAIALPSRAAASQDDVALALKDSIGLIGSDDTAAAAALGRLAQADDARPLRDVVLYFLARAERHAAPAAAAAHLDELLASSPGSPLAARAAADLLELDATRVNPGTLTPLLDRHTGNDDPRTDAARLALIIGERLMASDPTAAGRALQRARHLGRGNEASRTAAHKLREIRAAHVELVPKDAQEMYEEAKLAGAEGDLVEQAAWLDRMIAQFPSSPRYGDALLLRARVISRSEGRSPAAAWLESRAKTGSGSLKATLLHAASNYRWNADEDDRALSGFARVIALKIGGRITQESHYSSGRIHESHQHYAAAVAEYQRALVGPDEALAAESDWRAGWALYLARNYSEAAKSFAAMAERYRDKQPKSGRESALYWHARSIERSARPADAAAIYQRLLAEFPDGYYAYLTERRTGFSAAKPRSAALPPVLAEAADAMVRERVQRIAVLNAAGLYDIASIEIDRLIEDSNVESKRSLLPELGRLGAHGAALRTALDLYRRNRLTEAELYPFLYPPAFSLLVTRDSATNGIDPYLVYSLMKQESLFDPRAVSPAFAYGLMQLLPSTARRVAGGAEIAGEDLFDPALNIRLGTAYLAELSRSFGGEPVFMLAGYNAGESAAATWRTRYGKLEIDELIERISYRETRDYVKKVLANYRNYLRLYGDPGSGAGGQQSEQALR